MSLVPMFNGQKKHMEQTLLNNQLEGKISELQKELLQVQDVRQRLYESVASCKDVYNDVLSVFQVKLLKYICSSQE